MRRGERKLWRDVAAAATKMAESDDYAKEYFARREFDTALGALLDRIAKAVVAAAGVTEDRQT